MEKIKILMVIPSLDGGGAERVMLHIINHLDREKFEVYLYVERYEGKYVADLRSDVRVICAAHRRGLARLLFLRREIRQLKPSVVFIMMLPIAALLYDDTARPNCSWIVQEARAFMLSWNNR